MPEDDIDYFRHRAEAELEMAQHAVAPEATATHYKLANAYLEQVEALERSALDSAEEGGSGAPRRTGATDADSVRPNSRPATPDRPPS